MGGWFFSIEAITLHEVSCLNMTRPEEEEEEDLSADFSYALSISNSEEDFDHMLPRTAVERDC